MKKLFIWVGVLIVVVGGAYFARRTIIPQEKSGSIGLDGGNNPRAEVGTEPIEPKQKATTENGTTKNNVDAKQTNNKQIFVETQQGRVKLPDPPPGFVWQKLEEVKGWVLKPESWYFLSEKKGTTQAYFVTEEKIVGGNEHFETGISMNVITASGVPGGDAYEYARTYAESFKKTGSMESSTEDEGGVVSVFRILGTFEDNGVIFKMAVEILANRKTNSLYLITFESKPEKWDLAWETGTLILSTMVIDDEI